MAVQRSDDYTDATESTRNCCARANQCTTYFKTLPVIVVITTEATVRTLIFAGWDSKLLQDQKLDLAVCLKRSPSAYNKPYVHTARTLASRMQCEGCSIRDDKN